MERLEQNLYRESRSYVKSGEFNWIKSSGIRAGTRRDFFSNIGRGFFYSLVRHLNRKRRSLVKYMKLDDIQREELLESLVGMTSFLYEAFGSLSVEESSTPGPDGSFSPVEQIWHLADLEREGFGIRLERLQVENHPHLLDFDGDRIAKERNYRALSVLDGLSAFEKARKANLRTLQSLPLEAWARSGSQESVGPVSLCDMPVFIL